jgi:hypothetical protein
MKMTVNAKKLSRFSDQTGDFAKKFRDAEQMWFWFLSCRQKDALKGAFSSHAPGSRAFERNPYYCEAMDVETLITRLYLSGRLSAAQLEVMKEFGDRRRAPNRHIWAENRKAALWGEAMREIGAAARNKGWSE